MGSSKYGGARTMRKVGMYQTSVNLPVYVNENYDAPTAYLMSGDVVILGIDKLVGCDDPLPFPRVCKILTEDGKIGEIPYYPIHWQAWEAT